MEDYAERCVRLATDGPFYDDLRKRVRLGAGVGAGGPAQPCPARPTTQPVLTLTLTLLHRLRSKIAGPRPTCGIRRYTASGSPMGSWQCGSTTSPLAALRASGRIFMWRMLSASGSMDGVQRRRCSRANLGTGAAEGGGSDSRLAGRLSGRRRARAQPAADGDAPRGGIAVAVAWVPIAHTYRETAVRVVCERRAMRTHRARCSSTMRCLALNCTPIGRAGAAEVHAHATPSFF